MASNKVKKTARKASKPARVKASKSARKTSSAGSTAAVRFNLIDFVIILVIIACILGTVFRGAILEKLSFASNSDTARVMFCAENLSEEELNAISVGDEFSLDGDSFGTVKSCAREAQTVVITAEDGLSFVQAVDNKSFTLTGEMEIKGQSTDEGFFFGADTHVGVGKVLNLSSEKCDISIVITKITENEA